MDAHGRLTVARLAADPRWQVTVLTGGKWSVAECSLRHAGRTWVIGLTPVRSLVALIVWCDDEVVAHARGTETAMCTAALEWTQKVRTT